MKPKKKMDLAGSLRKCQFFFGMLGCFLAAGSDGAVIESLDLESGLVQAGDLLLGWKRPKGNSGEGQEGKFDSAWDWHWFMVEIAPRGPLQLKVSRNGEPFEVSLDPETLASLQVRPHFAGKRLADYSQGLEKIRAGEVAQGTAIWQNMAAGAELRSWLTMRSSEAFGEAGDFEKGFELLALTQSQAPTGRPLMCVLMTRCHRLWRRQQLDAAERVAEQWYQLAKAEPLSLVFARCLNQLGNMAWGRGDLDTAEKHHRACQKIRQTLAPGSLALADTFNNLGLVADNRGQLEDAETYHRQALAIRQAKLPGSMKEAVSWLNLGLVKSHLGDTENAEVYLLKSVDLIEDVAPGNSLLAEAFTNLGVIKWQKSQLDQAELYLNKALDLKGKISKTSASYATSLHNLATLVYARGDLEKARSMFLDVLEIYEKKAPESIWLADVLNNLGAIAYKYEHWDQARVYFEKGVAINQELAPGSLSLAEALGNLGSIFEIMGYRDQAEERYLRALEIYEQKAPEGILHGNTLSNLAILTARRGDLKKALSLSERAYSLVKDLADSDRTGNEFSIMESGYRTYIDLLVQNGRKADAFNISEAFRAMSVLRQLEQRDILHGLFPDSQKRLKEIGSRCDTLQNQWWETDDEQAKDRLHETLLGLRVQAEGIRREILNRSPHLIEYGQSLNVQEISNHLEPGSLLLSFLVQDEGALAFALSKEDGLTVRSLPVSKTELAEKVKLFQAVAAEPGDSRIREVHQKLGQQLFQILLAPVKERLEVAERLILIPDGPLWYLPFAALGELHEGEFRYLIERKPITTVASATLYEYLKRQTHSDYGGIAAFGVPDYPDGSEERDLEPESRNMLVSQSSLSPLPGTRKEVAVIASLFPQTDLFLGHDATEANFKALGSGYKWIHVGSHAIYEGAPDQMVTGLYFSIPRTFVEGEENGVLQYREIFDLNLEADLLVLSACQTALGKDAGGQGLLGIARAFQYAGVRTIVASLWEVDDGATAQLMSYFYRYLHDGDPPAQALRRAQIDMIHGTEKGGFWTGLKALFGYRKEDYSSHLLWASFQAIGPY